VEYRIPEAIDDDGEPGAAEESDARNG
jgi:hypothetical protein